MINIHQARLYDIIIPNKICKIIYYRLEDFIFWVSGLMISTYEYVCSIFVLWDLLQKKYNTLCCKFKKKYFSSVIACKTYIHQLIFYIHRVDTYNSISKVASSLLHRKKDRKRNSLRVEECYDLHDFYRIQWVFSSQ